ncbi:hypothetical protein I6E50_01790 [Roseburia hominis]|uniref:hypothetical protein n=1 Tax=Roseburia hominis TaxID=301301 RepID=UPI001F323893|nr:hypothetical protein [Roseburia hominis]
MRVIENVTCGKEMAKPLVVGVTTVYVHENITPVTEPDPITGEIPTDLYTCREIQYTKDEYISLMAEKNDALNEQLLETQEALCNVYELLDGTSNSDLS